MARLYGAWWKFKRAYDQSYELAGQLQGHLDAIPWYFTQECELDTRQYVVRFGVRQLDDLLAVHLGEIVHNLRSSLDHAVWQLVIDNKRRPREYLTGFPVCTDEPSFREGRRAGRKMIDGVPDGARAIIEEVQPYKALDEGENPLISTLAVLNNLWNIDKHRTLNLITLIAQPSRLRIATDFDLVVVSRYTGGPLKHDTEIARVRPVQPSGNLGEVEVHMKISCNVALDEIEGGVLPGALIMDVVNDLARDVESILELLSGYAVDYPALTHPFKPRLDVHSPLQTPGEVGGFPPSV